MELVVQVVVASRRERRKKSWDRRFEAPLAMLHRTVTGNKKVGPRHFFWQSDFAPITILKKPSDFCENTLIESRDRE